VLSDGVCVEVNRTVVALALFVAAATGVLLGATLCRSVGFRDKIGVFAGRGHLRALAHGHGIYDADLPRTPGEQLALRRLTAEGVARDLGNGENVSSSQVNRRCALIEWQFLNNKLLQ